MLKEIMLVGVGGMAGSILRYLVSTALIGGTFQSVLPLGTFTVNAMGSLLIGLSLSWSSGTGLYFLCVVGFCGGFTTFSAEILNMIRIGNWSMATLYIATSIVVCTLATGLGVWIGEKIKL